MPTRRKQPPATNAASRDRDSKSLPNPLTEGGWKGKLLAFLAAFVILAAIWSTGIFNSLFAGPKVPLPRQVADLSLGMTLDEVLAKYPMMNLKRIMEENKVTSVEALLKKKPSMKKALETLKRTPRSFNNDPQFGISSIETLSDAGKPTKMDLIFYLPNNKLYFISAMWEADRSGQVPVADWANQFRRWKIKGTGAPENLNNNVTLKEWKFNDVQTEMTLRSLDFSGKEQKWQDLRDATNEPAQGAFAKYRLEAGS